MRIPVLILYHPTLAGPGLGWIRQESDPTEVETTTGVCLQIARGFLIMLDNVDPLALADRLLQIGQAYSQLASHFSIIGTAPDGQAAGERVEVSQAAASLGAAVYSDRDGLYTFVRPAMEAGALAGALQRLFPQVVILKDDVRFRMEAVVARF
jgi:hypothetical protein